MTTSADKMLTMTNKNIRGHLERVRFQIQLFRFREQEQHWKLIENFSKLVQRGHQTGELRTFDASQDLSPEIKDDTEGEEYGGTIIIILSKIHAHLGHAPITINQNGWSNGLKLSLNWEDYNSLPHSMRHKILVYLLTSLYFNEPHVA